MRCLYIKLLEEEEEEEELSMFNLWRFDVLGQAVSARLDRYSTLKDLRWFLPDEWTRIPKQTIQKLVYSSKNGVSECRSSIAGYTHYCHFLNNPCRC